MIVIFDYLANLRYSWGIQTIWNINPRVLWKCKAQCGCHEWFEQWQTDICAPGTLFGEYHGQYLCSPVIPDPQVVYFICDMKCHLSTWRFITTSSVATFGVTLKKGRAIMEFHFMCFICYSVCGLLMLMNWWSDSCFCIFWTCTTACCRLFENYCPDTFHSQVFRCFCYRRYYVLCTLVPTKSWWFAWWIPLGI